MRLKIPHIMRSDELLEKAFSSARKAKIIDIDPKRRVDSVREREAQRIDTVAQTIESYIEKILSRTPKIDELEPFYVDLISITIDKDQFKKSLAALKWVKKKTHEHSIFYKKKLKNASIHKLATIRKEFYGRQASLLKQISKDLLFLSEAKRTLREIPDIKDAPSLVIAGFPNVGKSSLLKELTGANPKIQNYPFTTKGILLGYIENRIQVVDTPGLLERPQEKRNAIEKKAISAIKNIASIVLFVFDVSKTAQDPKDQLALFKSIYDDFGVETIACINKIDDLDEEYAKFIESNLLCPIFKTSVVNKTGIEELKKYILKNIKSNMKTYRT